MKHINLKLQKLEERIAPGGCGCGTGGSHGSKGGSNKSHGLEEPWLQVKCFFAVCDQNSGKPPGVSGNLYAWWFNSRISGGAAAAKNCASLYLQYSLFV